MLDNDYLVKSSKQEGWFPEVKLHVTLKEIDNSSALSVPYSDERQGIQSQFSSF